MYGGVPHLMVPMPVWVLVFTQLGQDVLQVVFLDRIHEARHLDDRAAPKVAGEALIISCSAHEHQPQGWVEPLQALEQNQQEVCVHIPLMDLIDNDMAHTFQAGVALQLPKQDTHGAEEQCPTSGWGLAFQAHLEAHVPAQGGTKFMANPLRHRHS